MRVHLVVVAMVCAAGSAALAHPSGHAHLHGPADWTAGVLIGLAAVVVGAGALLVRRCVQRRR